MVSVAFCYLPRNTFPILLNILGHIGTFFVDMEFRTVVLSSKELAGCRLTAKGTDPLTTMKSNEKYNRI